MKDKYKNMTPFFMRLTNDMAERIGKKAKERGVPRASIIKDILFKGLKND